MAEVIPVALTTARICSIVIPSVIQTIRAIGATTTMGIQMHNAGQIGGFQEQNIQFFRQQILQNSSEELLNPLQLYLNGKRQLEDPYKQLNNILYDQIILKIKRCAMSLWNYFPSGIASFFTMLLFNQCVRHEYIIIYTQDYVVSAEISKSKDCSNPECLSQNGGFEPNQQLEKCQKCKKELGVKKNACIQVMIWDAPNQEDKKRIYKKYNDRFCSRVLKSFSSKKKNIAENFSFAKLLCLWTLMLKVYQVQCNQSNLQKFYHLLVRNCKTLARSSLYFLEKDLNKEKVFESILGLYSDKPGHVCDPIQSGILCLAEKGMEQSKNYKKGKTEIENIIEEIRSLSI